MNTNDYTYLAHHGILGMKWGVRRYQNKDGSLTSTGKKRYSKEGIKKVAKIAAGVAIGALAITGAAAIYSRNKKSVDSTVNSAGFKKLEDLSVPKSVEIKVDSIIYDKPSNDNNGSSKIKLTLDSDSPVVKDINKKLEQDRIEMARANSKNYKTVINL